MQQLLLLMDLIIQLVFQTENNGMLHKIFKILDFQDTVNYLSGLKGQHTGEDWNFGSGTQDVNKPVYSIGNGEVIKVSYIPDPDKIIDNNKGGWGRVILIKHTLPPGSKYEYVVSLYGHLGIDPNNPNYVDIHEGNIVKRNQKIGYIGASKENGGWTPHTHFEIRTPEFKTRFGTDTDPSKGYNTNPLGWVNPTSITSKNNPTKVIGFIDANRPSSTTKPVINSITPTQTIAGDFALTINGNNFDQSNVVDRIYRADGTTYVGHEQTVLPMLARVQLQVGLLQKLWSLNI